MQRASDTSRSDYAADCVVWIRVHPDDRDDVLCGVDDVERAAIRTDRLAMAVSITDTVSLFAVVM
jgi:hypothetical protein